jgi:hypothetical protein
MPHKRRTFRRTTGLRTYRKIFVLAVEGSKTEPQYFAVFNSEKSHISVKCIKGKHDSSPKHVLRRMEDYLESENLRKSDEAWLVVDKDHWTDEQLEVLHQWTKKSDNYHLAVSNPKFEYWLLLHFEIGNGVPG